jgi:hypothetical protein
VKDGAAGIMNGPFVVVPPRATSVTCPINGPLDERCSDATYAIGHELGHTFGLCHTCKDECEFQNDPQCRKSIMNGNGIKMPNAILVKGEVDKVKKTCFFSLK